MEKGNVRNRPEQNSRARKHSGAHRRAHPTTGGKSPQGNNFNDKGQAPANLKLGQVVLDRTSPDVALQEKDKGQASLTRPWLTVIIDSYSRSILCAIVSHEEVATL